MFYYVNLDYSVIDFFGKDWFMSFLFFVNKNVKIYIYVISFIIIC